MNAKELAGIEGAAYLCADSVVGLGTGSTVTYTLHAIADKMSREGFSVTGVPTSEKTAALARELGIPLTTLDAHPRLDLTVDGADEVDPDLNLIKGGGGALFREKVVASASDSLVIVVEASKLVDKLGLAFPVPVEISPFGFRATRIHLEALGCTCDQRMTRLGPFVTDNGNPILDCAFPDGIPSPARLEAEIDAIPGVIESGLFVGLAHTVVVGYPDGRVEVMERG